MENPANVTTWFCKNSKTACQRVVLSKEGGKRRGRRERKWREGGRKGVEREELRGESRGIIKKGWMSQVDEYTFS